VKKTHFYPSLAGLLALVAAFCFVPLPQSVLAPLEIQARDAESSYVDVPGKLISIEVKPGQTVKKGDVLGRLQNHGLEMQIVDLRGKVELYRLQAENLRQESAINQHAAGEISSVEANLASAEEQLSKREADFERLCLRAPIDGVVLPPSFTPKREDPDLQLGAWSGTPLDPENLGAYLDVPTLFCQIGDPKKLQAVMVIDQGERNLIDRGQKVHLKIDQLPGEFYESKITDIAEAELKEAPKRLSSKHGGEVATVTDPITGIEKPQSTSYQADAPLDDDKGLMRLGLRGTARIYTRWTSLGERSWRFLMNTFNFKL
jgi:putative peptide zinc metalloprotease protein